VASAAGVAVSYRLNTQSIPAEGFEFVYATTDALSIEVSVSCVTPSSVSPF